MSSTYNAIVVHFVAYNTQLMLVYIVFLIFLTILNMYNDMHMIDLTEKD